MNTNFNTKRMTTNAILIAIGAILHYITPLFSPTMQPDLSLAMLFIIIVYNKDYKTCAICGLIVGIFAALTTKAPGGQLPNIIDKFVTTNIVYFALIPLREKLSKAQQMLVLLPFGTLISGSLFITVYFLLGGIPASALQTMFVAVVLPTVVLNFILGFILYKAVEKTIGITGAYSM
ncbi:tryptophan transporter [uncultured Clostridium sp.]|uniref:tryptophan transporter n=1 Tax=uncultured Clostridium sp. TaxID=59620 RepID=UPI0025F3A66E|nr:tryptophan transporter [uncultured Clostridium sp.]